MAYQHLEAARALTLPSREAMLQRAQSVQQFWDGNQELLANAWKEWEAADQVDGNSLNSSLLDARLRQVLTLHGKTHLKSWMLNRYGSKLRPVCIPVNSSIQNGLKTAMHRFSPQL